MWYLNLGSRCSSPAALAILFLLVAPTAVVAAPTALAPLVSAPPKLDGVLDDWVWQEAPLHDAVWDNTGQRLADPPMRFRTVSDGHWLYIGAELSDPDPGRYDLTDHGRDGCSFTSETLELFLAPFADQPKYFQFALEPSGADFDNVAGGNAKDHNFGWRHAQRITADGWVAEIALPLTELDRPGGVAEGDILSLNVCRQTAGAMPLHCWSPTGGGFHNRSAFGELLIGSWSAPALALVGGLESQLTAARRAAGPAADTRAGALAERLARMRLQAGGLGDADAWRTFRAEVSKTARDLQRLALAGHAMVIAETDPWSLPPSGTLPPADVQQAGTIIVEALQGEYIERALLIANPGERTLPVRCYPSDFVSPDWRSQMPAAPVLTLKQAVEVGLRGGNGRQRDALPVVRLEDPIVIPSGENAVVWMTFDTHGLAPGVWTCGITVKPLLDSRLQRVVRVILRVLPAQLPQGPRPYSCGWTSLTAQPCVRYPEKCVADEKAHYTSVHIVGFGDLGISSLTYDEQGRATGAPDFSRLDESIRLYGTQGQIYVLGAFYEWLPKQLGGGGSWGEIEQANFAWYVRTVREHLASRGLSVRDFAWYAMDEPCTEEAALNVVNFGKLLQAADPEQQVFVTVYSEVTLEALRMMAPYVNLWVPSLGLNQQQREIVEKTRPEWRRLSYSVIGRSGHPYRNYRSNGLIALKRGYEGIGFWNYNDCGGSPNASVWDDNDGAYSDYAVIYEGSDGPVSSARWEGWRQGIQDYRCCEWLLQLADKCPDPALAQEARVAVTALLDEFARSGKTTTADEHTARMRRLALRLLLTSGALDPAAIPGAEISLPLCLTGNGGDLAESLDTGGFYTYNATPSPDSYGERSRVTEGPVYFKGAHAPSGPQAENRADGDLTDGLLGYPSDYSIHWWPPDPMVVTFDFQTSYRLSHAIFYGDKRPVRALVSETGTEGSWQEASAIAAPWPQDQLTYDGAAFLNLKPLHGRYVRLEITTGGEGLRMGEARIFGWPKARSE